MIAFMAEPLTAAHDADRAEVPRRAAARLANVFLFMGVLAAMLAVFELTGRHIIRVRMEQAPAVFPALVWADAHQYDPDLMWSMKPNLHNVMQFANPNQSPAMLTTNDLGLRNPPIRPKVGTRILCIGDSRTFGAGVEDAETYPAQLQAILDTQFPGRFEVINAGVSGYSAPQGLRYLELRGKALAPDIVIACFGHNEWAPVIPGGLGVFEWQDVSRSWGIEVLFKEAIRGAARMVAPRPLGERKVRVSQGEFIDTLLRMNEVGTEANGYRLLLMSWPALSETRQEPMAPPHRILSRAAADYLHIPLIDLFERVRDTNEDIYLDDLHMNARGCRIVAEHVATQLVEAL